MDDNQINSAFLALFLPALAGQSDNTGCHALAVPSRGIRLELRAGRERVLFLGLATVLVR